MALLFAGGPQFAAFDNIYFSMSDEMAVEAAEMLPAATIIPVHADSWEHFTQSAASLKRHADHVGVGGRFVILTPGESAAI